MRSWIRTRWARWCKYWRDWEEMMKDAPVIVPVHPGPGDMASPNLMMQARMMVPSNRWLHPGEDAKSALEGMTIANLCGEEWLEMEVPAGSRLMVVLEEIPSSGYSHELALPRGVRVLGDSFVDMHPKWEPDAEHAAEREKLSELGVAGAEAKRGLILFIDGNAEDETTLVFRSEQPWNPGDVWSEATLVLRLTR